MMIEPLDDRIDKQTLDEARKSLPNIKFKETLNVPTGRFFYDPWQIKPEYKNTVWDTILSSLPYILGEARLIKLSPGSCYYSHSDVDDRWHMNIVGEKSFLIDIDSEKMYSTNREGYWYSMDASPRHSAVNFGMIDRVQLVVRKLLPDIEIECGVKVSISGMENDTQQLSRYIFDDILSKWLNLECKNGNISGVVASPSTFEFILNVDKLDEFNAVVNGSGLNIKYSFDY